MFPPGTRGRARGLSYTMDAFMLGMGMLSESYLHHLSYKWKCETMLKRPVMSRFNMSVIGFMDP